jgi:hypothetical protein
MEKLNEILNYYEENIDPSHFRNVWKRHKDCLSFENTGKPVIKTDCPPTGFQPHSYTYKETTGDMAKMLYNELRGGLCYLETKCGGIPTVRANYGVGCLPSLFGLNSRIVNDSLPWVDRLSGADEIKRLIDRGIPDLNEGFGGKIIETYEFYNEVLKNYPKCNKYIIRYHPDLQGPFDVAHLIWGSDIYLALYDDPDLVKELMELVTDTYIAYMKKVKPYLNDEYGGCNFHWGSLFGGKITLRNDSSVNISKDAYIEFSKPYEQKILNGFGGGTIHFCGRADHLVFEMASLENLKGLNFGRTPNGEWGMEYIGLIYEKLKERKVAVCSYNITEDEAKSYDFEKYKNGITYVIWTSTVDAARSIVGNGELK